MERRISMDAILVENENDKVQKRKATHEVLHSKRRLRSSSFCLNTNEAVELKNPSLKNLKLDFLYHIGLSTNEPLKEQFNDIKFVVMGGSDRRMEKFAFAAASAMAVPIPIGMSLSNISDTGMI